MTAWSTLFHKAASSTSLRSGCCWIVSRWPTRLELCWASRPRSGSSGGLARGWVDPQWQHSVEQRAFPVFQLAQVHGLSPDILYRLSKQDWRRSFRKSNRSTAWSVGGSSTWPTNGGLYTQTLDAISLHVRQARADPRQPRFQAIFCIDEREESIRRHIEELAPDAETFGTAGFFSIAMYFRGAADAHFVPLCPAVIRPRHWVVERVIDRPEPDRPTRAETRRAAGDRLPPLPRRQPLLDPRRGAHRPRSASSLRSRWWPAPSSPG